MTDDEPNSVSMEDAMQAIRDALGYRDSLKPQRELIPNLPRGDDFFVKRLAAIEEKKTHDAHTERLCQSIPLITDCICCDGKGACGYHPWPSSKLTAYRKRSTASRPTMVQAR